MNTGLPFTNGLIAFWLLLGTTFGVIAGLSAFLIIYREYAQHRLSPRETTRHAASGALFAALFFFVGTLIVGFALSHVIHVGPD